MDKLNVCIIGAGISGLTIGRLLKENFNVEIHEKKNTPGGIARTKTINNVSYHLTGGHCFNSKYQDVLDFVFNNILPKDQWNNIERNAKINFKNNYINYPIEFSIKEIAKFDHILAIEIVKDFLNTNIKEDSFFGNLEDWFRKNFGDTLSEEYFIPYNRKIWNCEPKSMSAEWVKDKLPIPNKEAFFNGMIQHEKDKMPHSNFFYPKSNNQNTFIENLSNGLNIQYKSQINSIHKNQNNKWVINNSKEFDILINTSPLNILPQLIVECDPEIVKSASMLKYNKITTVLWESQKTDSTWTYLPSPETIFHRYIHIGNFFNPQKNYTISESVGEKTYKEMVENGKKDPFLITPLDYHVSEHAYVVYDENSKKNKEVILSYFNKIGIYNLGRFAEWEYYNMDLCIKSAINLKNKILKEYEL